MRICVTTNYNSYIVHLYRAHYPGTNSDSDAMKTGKPLWASEDYSTYNDEVGTGCWARVSTCNLSVWYPPLHGMNGISTRHSCIVTTGSQAIRKHVSISRQKYINNL